MAHSKCKEINNDTYYIVNDHEKEKYEDYWAEIMRLQLLIEKKEKELFGIIGTKQVEDG